MSTANSPSSPSNGTPTPTPIVPEIGITSHAVAAVNQIDTQVKSPVTARTQEGRIAQNPESPPSGTAAAVDGLVPAAGRSLEQGASLLASLDHTAAAGGGVTFGEKARDVAESSVGIAMEYGTRFAAAESARKAQEAINKSGNGISIVGRQAASDPTHPSAYKDEGGAVSDKDAAREPALSDADRWMARANRLYQRAQGYARNMDREERMNDPLAGHLAIAGIALGSAHLKEARDGTDPEQRRHHTRAADLIGNQVVDSKHCSSDLMDRYKAQGSAISAQAAILNADVTATPEMRQDAIRKCQEAQGHADRQMASGTTMGRDEDVTLGNGLKRFLSSHIAHLSDGQIPASEFGEPGRQLEVRPPVIVLADGEIPAMRIAGIKR